MTTAADDRYRTIGERFAGVIPHVHALGMAFVSAERGRATLTLPWQERLVGNLDTGVLHGGVITTLIDTASGLAVFLALDQPPAIATLDLRIDYLKPATARAALLAEAHCYKVTRSIAFVRAIAHHGDAADPIAHSASTFMLDAPGRPIAKAARGSA
jgi:uncharacterized protein (TIGR00369 family)